QQALKIIANASYGYLAFPRARWYCKECAEAITAWARQYIKWVMEEAERWGLKVIYGDTDSVFLSYQKEEDVIRFLEHVNAKLPGMMELELEGFYVRGIFIKRRRGERAAKKKYALIDKQGNLKITGMEYVRRDWSEIARETQKKVLELILGKGNVEGALNYVRKVIEDVKRGRVPLEKLIIYTEIQKELDAYEQSGPHVEAAKKLRRMGYRVKPGTIVGYIVAKGGGSVSERAEPVELFKGEYDPDYYVERQILPAVLPIFETLGYSEKDLKKPQTQRSIFDFV
ncbi:MAG: DNA polymerase, partial [Candidatus Diapherotrites archaeon]|nr:DNA polymerase [Candidatus Diapherotrites archaeon]